MKTGSGGATIPPSRAQAAKEQAGVFIVGLKRLERARGSGWLDCPNCHEHALQDVIDAMRFAAIGGYRLMPVERKRFLICRRCSFRRQATPEVLHSLETMGHPLRRAWFVPFGVIALALLGTLVYVAFASPSAGSTIPGITFTKLNGGDLVPATVEVPNSWNTAFFTKVDDLPPPRVELQTTSTGLEKIVLARFSDTTTLGALVLGHFADQTSLEAQQFPSAPPTATCSKVGGATAAVVKIPYMQAGAKAELIMYAFFHGPAGYTMTFVASGAGNITTMEQIAQHAISSFTFTGNGGSASPGASASPGTSPSPSASASASPSASAAAGASAGASPTASYTVSCA